MVASTSRMTFSTFQPPENPLRNCLGGTLDISSWTARDAHADWVVCLRNSLINEIKMIMLIRFHKFISWNWVFFRALRYWRLLVVWKNWRMTEFIRLKLTRSSTIKIKIAQVYDNSVVVTCDSQKGAHDKIKVFSISLLRLDCGASQKQQWIRYITD